MNDQTEKDKKGAQKKKNEIKNEEKKLGRKRQLRGKT